MDYDDLMENMIYLPTQLDSTSATYRSAEHVLAVAVIEAAFLDLTKTSRRGVKYCRWTCEDALAWIEATDRNWEFSFVNLCTVIDLDVEATRVAARHIAADTISRRDAGDAPRVVMPYHRVRLDRVICTERIRRLGGRIRLPRERRRAAGDPQRGEAQPRESDRGDKAA